MNTMHYTCTLQIEFTVYVLFRYRVFRHYGFISRVSEITNIDNVWPFAIVRLARVMSCVTTSDFVSGVIRGPSDINNISYYITCRT